MRVEDICEFDVEGMTGSIRKVGYSGFYVSYMGRDGHYCGYVRFPDRPVKETGYDGILTYVPVHGGITYAEPDKDGGITYGFDCAHADDEKKPETDDLEWLKAQCLIMKRGIELAAKYEDEYLLAASSEARAEIIDRYHKELGEGFDLQNNFGAMINVLFGQL